MDQRISLVTLGVTDLARARSFYEALGWGGARQPDDEVCFFQAGGMVFGLWTALGGHGAPGIELAHNVRSPEEVSTVLAEAGRAGGTVVRPAAPADWGGTTGAFADPDGYVWEVAHNPGWTLESDGAVRIGDFLSQVPTEQDRTMTQTGAGSSSMDTPATTLDPRYSDSHAVAASWEETLEVLETAELFWISTVRPDGRPHVTPLVAVWAEGALHFHTGAGEQKFANLQTNPHVVLTTGANGWDSGLDVVVEGDAVHVTDQVTLTRIAGLWASKWDGRWQFSAGDGGFTNPDWNGWSSQVFTVKPVTVYAHAKGDPFGATTHRF